MSRPFATQTKNRLTPSSTGRPTSLSKKEVKLAILVENDEAMLNFMSLYRLIRRSFPGWTGPERCSSSAGLPPRTKASWWSAILERTITASPFSSPTQRPGARARGNNSWAVLTRSDMVLEASYGASASCVHFLHALESRSRFYVLISVSRTSKIIVWQMLVFPLWTLLLLFIFTFETSVKCVSQVHHYCLNETTMSHLLMQKCITL